jgi:hypothetical protein
MLIIFCYVRNTTRSLRGWVSTAVLNVFSHTPERFHAFDTLTARTAVLFPLGLHGDDWTGQQTI